MKKALAGFLIIGASLFSCYDSGSEFSRVLLLIDTPPTVNINKLYVGVFLGAVTPQTLITKISFTPSNIYPLVIPGNQILIFVVWAGETIPPNEAVTYLGYSPPLLMQGQDFALVPLTMNQVYTDYSGPPPNTMNFQVINGQNDAIWSPVPSADYYEVYDGFGALIYQGPGTSCHFPSPVSSARARFCSSVFGICSDFVQFTT